MIVSFDLLEDGASSAKPPIIFPLPINGGVPCLGDKIPLNSMKEAAIVESNLAEFDEVEACLWPLLDKQINCNIS